MIWLIVIGASVFGVLQIVNYLHNSDTYSGSTIMKTNYILSISPDTIDEKGKVTVSLNTLKSSPVDPSLSLFIVYPNSKYQKLPYLIGDHLFPSNSSTLPKGIYRVTLFDNLNNNEIIAVNFNVSSYNWYNQIYDSLSVGNITSLIPLLIPIIGFLYNLAARQSEERQKRIEQEIADRQKRIEQEIADRNRILEEKLKWLQEIMKYYLRIAAYCFEVGHMIAKLFGKEPKLMANDAFDISVICSNDECESHLDTGDLLDRIIKLIFSIKEFNKDIGYYYFDSVNAETYVNILVDEVEKQSKHLFFENQKFLRFVTRYKKMEDDISYTDSKLEGDVKTLKQQLSKSICIETIHTCSKFKGECCKSNIECYYRNLLALHWVIHTCISKIAAISYSKRNMEAGMEAHFKTYEPQIQNHVLKSMPGIFGENCVPAKLWDELFSFNSKNSK